MTHTQRFPILLPLVVAASVFVCTILMHGLALNATVKFIRRQVRLGRAGVSFWSDVAIVVLTTSLALLAHLTEIALWAVLFMMCGEFREFGAAYYHSAVNYTTLGYGDVLMTPSWRLLGPLEAANGALMFGVSTAMVVGVVQLLVRARYADLG
jgi:hypothetical protein